MNSIKKILIIFLIISILISSLFIIQNQINKDSNTSTTSTSKITYIFDPDVDVNEKPEKDPYENINKDEFYANYSPANSYWDAYYRTKHNLMSGSIDEQNQEPTIADNQPKENGLFIKNSSTLYSSDGNIYYVIDDEGNVVNKIYKGGAYVTLEEVAAYVFAFGDVPANYSTNKNEKPSTNPWGKYLRVNNTQFSGSTTKYPYEPELPNISGCGGDLKYYEIDIGTTGTDCDPKYTPSIYNNGSKIVRGAARIVYSRYDKNGDKIIDIDEKFVFYTYNHYNDFQEYLNYEGGWGEMFGNITGGGTISSKYDYNPTPYVAVVRKNLYKGATQTATAEYIEVAFIYFDKKYYYDSIICA